MGDQPDVKIDVIRKAHQTIYNLHIEIRMRPSRRRYGSNQLIANKRQTRNSSGYLFQHDDGTICSGPINTMSTACI